MVVSRKQIRKNYYQRHKRAENARSRVYHWANRARLCAAMSDRQYRRKYGISAADKLVMLANQDGLCAACGSDKPGGRWGWVIDHDHKTGIVRGVLCHYCNVTLGNAQESIARLHLLITYLESHR